MRHTDIGIGERMLSHLQQSYHQRLWPLLAQVEAPSPFRTLSSRLISRGLSQRLIRMYASYDYVVVLGWCDTLQWSGRSQTVRYPSSSHPTQDLTNNLNSLKAQTLQHLRQMFQFVNTWPAFADHTTDPSNTDKSNSLESIRKSLILFRIDNDLFLVLRWFHTYYTGRRRTLWWSCWCVVCPWPLALT